MVILLWLTLYSCSLETNTEKNLENSYCSITENIDDNCTLYGMFIKSNPPSVKFNSSGDCSNYPLENWVSVVVPKILKNSDNCNQTIDDIEKIIIEFDESSESIPSTLFIKEHLSELFLHKTIDITLIESSKIVAIKINTMPNKMQNGK